MKTHKLFLLLVLLAAHALSTAIATPACQKASEICVEGPETRNISGAQVTKSCWRYQAKYDCVGEDAIDNCAPLRNNSVCFQTDSVCSEKAFNGDCLTYKNTYRCSNSIGAYSTIITLPMQYTIKRDEDVSTCTDFASNPHCQKTGSVCVEPGGTRNINGLDVTKDCWKREDTFACVAAANDCQDLKSNPSCKMVGLRCESTNSDGSCALLTYTYSCKTGTTPSQDKTVCGGTTVCLNGVCFDNPNQGTDTDLAKSIALMEAAREAAGYATDKSNLRFFSGEDNHCDIKLLNSCCTSTTSGGNMSNGAMVSTVVSGAMSVTGQAIKQSWGSWYVIDSLSEYGSNANFMEALLTKFSPDTLSGFKGYDFSGVSFSYYGLTFNPFLSGADMFAFDPTSMAVSVAIQVIMSMMSCTQNEQMLSMKRGRDLCHYVGTRCVDKFLGMCIKSSQSLCCFNSKLARIIQDQGRIQLAQDWGNADAPRCEGFSQADFERIDFSKIDLSEFVQDVMNNVKLPSVDATNAEINKSIQEKLTNYYSK